MRPKTAWTGFISLCLHKMKGQFDEKILVQTLNESGYTLATVEAEKGDIADWMIETEKKLNKVASEAEREKMDMVPSYSEDEDTWPLFGLFLTCIGKAYSTVNYSALNARIRAINEIASQAGPTIPKLADNCVPLESLQVISTHLNSAYSFREMLIDFILVRIRAPIPVQSKLFTMLSKLLEFAYASHLDSIFRVMSRFGGVMRIPHYWPEVLALMPWATRVENAKKRLEYARLILPEVEFEAVNTRALSRLTYLCVKFRKLTETTMNNYISPTVDALDMEVGDCHVGALICLVRRQNKKLNLEQYTAITGGIDSKEFEDEVAKVVAEIQEKPVHEPARASTVPSSWFASPSAVGVPGEREQEESSGEESDSEPAGKEEAKTEMNGRR